MACGLFGCSVDDATKIDPERLTILGAFNKERGTNAAGMMSNSDSVKSVKNGDFLEFVVQDLNYDELINEDTTVILGHTRNASPSTGRGLDTAQPCISSAEIDGLNYNFGLIHNGNIKSAEDRLEELKLPKSNLSDSYDFHKVLLNTKNMKAELKNYVGKAALVWTNPEANNEIFVFKGSSKATRGAIVTTEERPLWYVQIEDGSLYFSSTPESLMAAFREWEGDITEFKSNVLYKISEGEIIEETPIDRSGSHQVEDYGTNYSNSNWYDNHYGGYGTSKTYGYNKHNHKDKTISSTIALNAKRLTSFANATSIRLKAGRYVDFYDKLVNGFKMLTAGGFLWTPTVDIASTAPIYLAYFDSGQLLKLDSIEFRTKMRPDLTKSLLHNHEADHFTLTFFRTNSATPFNFPQVDRAVELAYTDSKFSNGEKPYYFTKMVGTFTKGNLSGIHNSQMHPVPPSTAAILLDKDQLNAIYALMTLADLKLVFDGMMNFIKTKNSQTSLALLPKDVVKPSETLVTDDVIQIEDLTDEGAEDLQAIIASEDEFTSIKETILDEFINMKLSLEAAMKLVIKNSYKDNDLQAASNLKQMENSLALCKAIPNMMKQLKFN
jgi:hypothetical protein